MKTCSKCKVEKELDQFHMDMSRADHKRGMCKACRKDYLRLRPPLKRRRPLRTRQDEYYDAWCAILEACGFAGGKKEKKRKYQRKEKKEGASQNKQKENLRRERKNNL